MYHSTVYCPIAHWNWHPNGFLFKAGVLDFAGGNVVHIASGCSGLASVFVIGNRKGFGKERFDPHNILYTVVGVSFLWVGWLGFNGGSWLYADGRAGMACLVTMISAAMGGLTWMFTEWALTGKPSVLSMVSGIVSGLVAITPASGFVDATGAFFIGSFSGPVCLFGAKIKHYLGFDDALDAFGVHSIGGTLGGLMTGFFAETAVYGGQNAILQGVGSGYTLRAYVLGMQVYGIVVTIGWSFIVTYIILVIIDNTMGLRVSEDHEEEGLDSSMHGHTIDGPVDESKLKKVHSADFALEVVAAEEDGYLEEDEYE